MNAVYFTCSRDLEKATFSASLMRGVNVHFCLDGLDQLASGIVRIERKFPTCGNLNGRACFKGIHQTIFDISRNGKPVLKIDSDTIADPSSFIPEEGGMVAVARGHMFWGCCYSISPTASEQINDLVKSGWWPFRHIIGEDMALFYAAHYLRIPVRFIPNEFLGWGNDISFKGKRIEAIHCNGLSAQQMKNLWQRK